MVEGDVELLRKKKSLAYRIGVNVVVVPYMSCLYTEDIGIDVSRNCTHAHKIAQIDLRNKHRLKTIYKTYKISLMLQ